MGIKVENAMRRPNLDLEDESISKSQAFRLGSSTAVENVIKELDVQAAKRVKAGFNEFMFTFGVLNCFVILYIFGVYPQHFWLLYLIEAIYFLPAKFIQMIRAVPNQALYFLDFCWIVNFGGIVTLCILMFGRGALPEYFHKEFFLAAFGVSCGMLLASNITLPFIALIFHDVNSMTSLFIHIFPPLLVYVFMWHTDAVKEAWPNVFFFENDIDFFPTPDVTFTRSVFGSTTIVYFMWFVPYTVWMLLMGLELPKNGGKFDTVFHANMRNGLCINFGNIFWKRPVELSIEQNKTSEFEMRDFFLYSAGHVICSFSSLFILAYSCSLSQYVHATMLVICSVICTWRGAQRYTYYSTKMYSSLIRKQFATQLQLDSLSHGSVTE